MQDSTSGTSANSRAWARPALKISLIYIILGLIWILFSDKLVAAIVHDSEVITQLQTIKGWFYVLSTGLLLFVLVRNSLSAHRQVESILRQRNRELDLANRLGQKLNFTLEFEEVIETVLQEICQTLDVIACSVWLIDDGTQELVCHKATNPADVFIQGLRLSPGQGIVGWAVSQKQSAVIADVRTDERHCDGINRDAKVEIRSLLAVPLIVRKSPIGAVEVVHTKKDRFKPSDLVLIELLAASAASAIENASLYSQLQAHTSDLEARMAVRNQELERANVELQELDRLKSKFVSDVSHELRTPVTNLMMYLDLLDMGKPEKIKKYLAVLQDQAKRLAQLIESILDLSRLEAGKGESVDLEIVNLNELMQQIAVTYIPRAEKLGLQLIYKGSRDLPPVRGVRSQLAQVVTNLLANALNYTKVGYIRMSTHLDTNTSQVCLEVKDTGIGIPSKDIKHIFSRFYRGQNVSQSNQPGSGLGLAIAQEIIEQHRGKIEARSTVGVGSAFRVWLPAVDK